MTKTDMQDIIQFAKRNDLMRLPFLDVYYVYKSYNAITTNKNDKRRKSCHAERVAR